MNGPPEFKIIADAVRSVAMKVNAGEITRDDIGDLLHMFLNQACVLNNALVDSLPREHAEDGPMAFADMLFELSEMMRDNGGKLNLDHLNMVDPDQGMAA